MLAQNFKSAADLGITEPQLSALQKTLVLLETGNSRNCSPQLFDHRRCAVGFGCRVMSAPHNQCQPKSDQPWRDPERYKTGRLVKCLGCKVECHKSPWGAWCYACNVPRIERIDAAFAPLRATLQSEKTP